MFRNVQYSRFRKKNQALAKASIFYSQHWMVIDIIPEKIKSLFLNPDKRFFGLKFNDTDDLRQCMILKIKKNKTNFKMLN